MRRSFSSTLLLVLTCALLSNCASTPQQRADAEFRQRMDRLMMSHLPESEQAKHRGVQGAMRSAGYKVGGVLAFPIIFLMDPSLKKMSH
jgi:hypothetical protein